MRYYISGIYCHTRKSNDPVLTISVYLRAKVVNLNKIPA
jgi:hypothetical protein